MISEMFQKILHGTCYVATGSAIFGAFTSDQLFTWSAVAIAISSACITAGLAGYHRLREAARQENIADRAADLESIRAMARIQIELENRVATIEKTANELAGTLLSRKTEFEAMFSDLKVRIASMGTELEAAKCKFPAPDGTAACIDEDRAENRGIIP